MSRQNVDAARRMLRAFNEGDTEAPVAECDPTVKWEEPVKETDDTVIACLCFEDEGTSSRVRVQMHVHLVCTFRDGKLTRRQVFHTLAEAVEAAGPRE